MPTILLAIENRQQRNDFSEAIRECPDLSGYSLMRTSSITGVLEALEDSDDIVLLVMDYDLRPRSSEGRSDVSDSVVDIATSLVCGKIESLILGPLSKRDRLRVETCDSSTWIEMTDFLEAFDDQGSLFGPYKIAHILDKGGEEEVEGGVIDLIVGKHNTMNCKTHLIERGHFMTLHDREPFQFDRGILEDMNTYTQNLSGDNRLTEESFFRNYRSIGRKARTILFSDAETRDAVRELISRAGGIEKTWLRFQMPFNDFPETPFEAILQCDRDDDDNDDFQLALSPVYRVIKGVKLSVDKKIRAPVLSRHVNKEPGKISCLVISAPSSGLVKTVEGVEFPKLSKIDSSSLETGEVLKIFNSMKDRGLIANVGSIDFSDDDELQHPIESLEKKLAERQWDIVHYNGHSYFTEVDKIGKGYIFLPGVRRAHPVNVETLASWCENTDFVFLSSCQSAAPKFIHSLAGRGIPMIMGYRWNVSDEGAACFARHFYKELFAGERIGNIEAAFSATQRSLKNPVNEVFPAGFNDKTIWASSMLVLQNV